MAKPAFFFPLVMYQSSRRRWQGLSPTRAWPGNWDSPARNKSKANFDKSRSGKRCIESISKSCNGKNRPDRQSFPSPKINRWEKNAMNIDSKSTGQNGGHLRWTFRHAKSLPLAAAVLVLLTIFIAASQSLSASFPVWISPSLVRVGQTDAPGTASSISLSGARGETVDTQVVVQAPSSGLSNVNLSASALTGPGGATIPASSLTLYRE